MVNTASPVQQSPNPQMAGMMGGMAQVNLGTPMGQAGMAGGNMQGTMGGGGMRQQQQQPMMMGQAPMGMAGGMNQMAGGGGGMGMQFGAYGAK